ncbi:MAG: type VI secretion protein ImpB [Sphingomonas sp.]|nr:type VI secretion protein ImpB [Sphingomonas sp.]
MSPIDSLARKPLRCLFIDFNSYFAAVEQHDEPALRDRPVIVAPLASEHSGAIAVSYEARDAGIRRGTPVREARLLCPGLAVRVARHDRYVIVHNLLMDEIKRHLPVTRIYSIDECACRLSRDEAAPEAAIAKAREIKAGIAANVGAALRCSIGLAPTPLLAKLAAELHKPDGLTVLEARALPDALVDLPLSAIPGIGPGVARRLEKAGVADFMGLWALPPKHARAIWGSVVGERFAYALHGHDLPDEPQGAKAMIGHSRVLSAEHRRPERARIVARALLLRAASRLRHYGLYAGHIALALRARPEGGAARDRAIPATQNSWALLKALDRLWAEALADLPAGSRARLATVSVSLHSLSQAAPMADLFTPPAAREAELRQTRLWTEIDALNRRYESQAVALASQRGLGLDYLGVKIAFSRVPEAAEFLF